MCNVFLKKIYIEIFYLKSLWDELNSLAPSFLKVWPEVTDPEKFVFEDVAIATYLLVRKCIP